MSLQTYVLENDEWVARTISADELMRDNSTPHRKTGRQSFSKPPTCGLLTRTVVESPVIRWVLPVQLRSARYNDVALIGVSFLLSPDLFLTLFPCESVRQKLVNGYLIRLLPIIFTLGIALCKSFLAYSDFEIG